MTREELLALVNTELGSTRLTLDERTINEELDDSLGDFGDDTETNAKLVTRIAKRLKRMDGNVHAVVSHEVEEYKKNYKPKAEKKPREDEDAAEEEKIPQWAQKLIDDVRAEKEARQAEKAERDKKDLLASVRKGLEDKFRQSGTEANGYFTNAALAKLTVPDKDADVNVLVAEAERLYNADMKEAGFATDAPRAGGGKGGGKERVDEHEWDDVAEIVGRDRPKPQS